MPPKNLTIALVPLDERPVNTRYPQMLGAIGGVTVLLPPQEIRGLQRIPSDLIALDDWLHDAAQRADAAAVSCDYLGYGNLINGRISQDSAAEVIIRLAVLADINRYCPVHAFSLITRVSNADDNIEEPLYWETWGTKFYRYARLAHQDEQSLLSPEEKSDLAELAAHLPADLKADWLTRRLRNHTVNLCLMDMAARGKLASLLLTSDDTSAYGFPSRERDWLRGWPRLIGPALSENVQMHPGADEVGSALLAKMLNTHESRVPRVWIEWSHPGGDEIIAPYEDRPVRETVIGQIHACGCAVADSFLGSDFVLGVATPTPRRTDFRPEFVEEDKQERTADYQAFLERLGYWQRLGNPIALADVAYPNGSDPLLSSLLLASDSPLQPGLLCAYGAWNTAGNTLGTVIAQASCALRADDTPNQSAAQDVFLAHRFLEDYGYQLVIRREARALMQSQYGHRDPALDDPEQQTFATEFVARRLAEMLADLQSQGIGKGLEIAPSSVRLPWRRLFEVDFELISAGN